MKRTLGTLKQVVAGRELSLHIVQGMLDNRGKKLGFLMGQNLLLNL